jgi:RDD family
MKHEISLGRRLLGLTIDWLACYAIAQGFFGDTRLTLVIFFIETFLLTALGGATAGHRAVRVRVGNYQTGQNPTILQSLVRTILLCLVVTAITYDDEGRGIHERLSQTKLFDLKKPKGRTLSA